MPALPGIVHIFHGMIAEVSIGKPFITGNLPGMLFDATLFTLITIGAMINPVFAPRGEINSPSERIASSAGT